MKIILLDLPVHIPTVMPYSIAMMQAVLASELDEVIEVLDLNATYHTQIFKEDYQKLGTTKDFFGLLDNFVKKTRNFYPRISQAVLKGKRPEAYETIIKHVLDRKPDVVAISMTYNSQVFFARWLIEDLIASGIKVIIGGPGDHSKISSKAVCLKDYDSLLKYLISIGAVQLKEKMPALMDFSIFEKSKYFTRDMVYPLRTAYSCPYKLCTFCTHHANRKYETIDLGYIRDTIVKNKMKKICFIDDCFTASRLKELADKIMSLNVTYWMQLRPTKDMIGVLPQLYRSGLRSVAWGLESGSQRILDLMRKGTRLQDIEEVLRTSHELGIKNQVYVMFGLPGETKEEFMETIGFLERNKDNIDLISHSVFGLQEGSPIYAAPEKHGIRQVFRKKRTLLGEQVTYIPAEGLDHADVEKLKKANMHILDAINKLPKVINSCKEQVLNL